MRKVSEILAEQKRKASPIEPLDSGQLKPIQDILSLEYLTERVSVVNETFHRLKNRANYGDVDALVEELKKRGLERVSGTVRYGAKAIVLEAHDWQMVRISRDAGQASDSPDILKPLNHFQSGEYHVHVLPKVHTLSDMIKNPELAKRYELTGDKEERERKAREIVHNLTVENWKRGRFLWDGDFSNIALIHDEKHKVRPIIIDTDAVVEIQNAKEEQWKRFQRLFLRDGKHRGPMNERYALIDEHFKDNAPFKERLHQLTDPDTYPPYDSGVLHQYLDGMAKTYTLTPLQEYTAAQSHHRKSLGMGERFMPVEEVFSQEYLQRALSRKNKKGELLPPENKTYKKTLVAGGLDDCPRVAQKLKDMGFSRVSSNVRSGLFAIVLEANNNQMIRIVSQACNEKRSFLDDADILQPINKNSRHEEAGCFIDVLPKIHTLDEVVNNPALALQYGLQDEKGSKDPEKEAERLSYRLLMENWKKGRFIHDYKWNNIALIQDENKKTVPLILDFGSIIELSKVDKLLPTESSTTRKTYDTNVLDKEEIKLNDNIGISRWLKKRPEFHAKFVDYLNHHHPDAVNLYDPIPTPVIIQFFDYLAENYKEPPIVYAAAQAAHLKRLGLEEGSIAKPDASRIETFKAGGEINFCDHIRAQLEAGRAPAPRTP